jgi:hypothetical protein
VATPAELASTEDPVGACDEEAEVMPAGKRPPETEINGLEKNPSTGINPGLGFLLDNSKLNYLRSFKICLSLNRSLIL